MQVLIGGSSWLVWYRSRVLFWGLISFLMDSQQNGFGVPCDGWSKYYRIFFTALTFVPNMINKLINDWLLYHESVTNGLTPHQQLSGVIPTINIFYVFCQVQSGIPNRNSVLYTTVLSFIISLCHEVKNRTYCLFVLCYCQHLCNTFHMQVWYSSSLRTNRNPYSRTW